MEIRTEDAARERLIRAALDGDENTFRTLFAERPGLAARSAYAAAAVGDGRALGEFLRREPALAKSKGGPREWEPLLYLCFGRCGGGDRERAAAARELLVLGADPNSAYIDPRWPKSPYAALYGATGVNDFPELARVLLEAGADPNDGESRYHAAEKHHVASLEVLARFGADFSGKDAKWGNTPLYFLLGWQPPIQVMPGVEWLLNRRIDPNIRCGAQGETALHRAVSNGWDARIIGRLLELGADPALQRKDGRSARAIAVLNGRTDISEMFRGRGAEDDASDTDRFLGACMRGDLDAARVSLARDPGLPSRAAADGKRLVFHAAREGRAGALRAFAEMGFDLGSADKDGATPLHWAAWHGHAEAAKTLIAAGADLDRREGSFDASPLGWCDHGWMNCRDPKGDYAKVAELLLDAGAKVPPEMRPVPPMQALLKRRGMIV